MTEEKKMKVEFAPGCFDHFDGTQEELDALMAEIQDMFANMTPEEIEAQANLVDLDELLDDPDLTDDEVAHLANQLTNTPRTLQ